MKEADHATQQVRAVLEDWAQATRENRQDEVLKNHVADLVIFDVLAPMKYESADSYRRSWADWQPDTQGKGQFDLEHLTVTTGVDMATAHCFIRCGGTLPDGRRYQDLVRATFCLRNIDGRWKVFHQHISKPLQLTG